MADFVYPLGVICGLFGIFVLAQVVITYIWLRWFSAKATRCPECGRKGAGALLHSEVVDSKEYVQWKNARSFFGLGTGKRQRVEISNKTYEDHFECQYCGHQWTRTAQERKESPV